MKLREWSWDAYMSQAESDRLVDEFTEDAPPPPKRKLMTKAELEAFRAGVRAARELAKRG